MHKRITITLVWLIIVFIAMFGVYRFEKPKKFKLPLLRGEVVGAAPDFSAIHDIAERKEAFFNYLKPGVRYENSRILQERTLLKRIKKGFCRRSALISQSGTSTTFGNCVFCGTDRKQR